MKCPHCNQEHPDNFQFCPITGKKFSMLKACPSPMCPDYGKHILPLDSLFCPTCGIKLEDYDRSTETDDKEFYDNENDDTHTPCCPKCGSDDIDYDRHWPDCTCNDCGYVFDEFPQCPECESENVSDDGSGYKQFTCNDCGHVWGDEGVYDNEGNITTHYLEIYDVILGSTTRDEIIEMGGKRDYESNDESYKMKSGIDVLISDTSKYVKSIHWWFSSKQRNFPPSYEEIGITWDMSKEDLIERLRNLGFYVSLNHPVDIYSSIKVSQWNELTIYWSYFGTGNLQNVSFYYH